MTQTMSMVFVLGLAVLLLQTTLTAAQQFIFGECSLDIQDYFQSIYPEYKGTRRLRALEETTSQGDFEDLFLSRTQRLYRANGGSTTSTSASSSEGETTTDGSSQDGPVTSGAFGRFPKPKPSTDSYLPPIGAWDNARMAASGCTSCANGCCDAVDIEFRCGTLDVPLDYSNLAAGTITLAVYRVRLITPTFVPANRTHLWVLQGGPGGSGLSILGLAVPSLQFASDIYVPDHRGTGFSDELSCPIQQAFSSVGKSEITASEVSGCYTTGSQFVGADFKNFTVTAAARDLERMITAARSQFAPLAVFVHGYSYGTRWAQRFLQIFPNVADKVVLEGVVAKDTVFNDFAVGSQTAGLRFMQKCMMNSKCQSFFPSTSLASTIASIAAQGTSNMCSLMMCGFSISQATVRTGVQFVLNSGLIAGVDGPYRNVPGFEGQDILVDFRTFGLAMVSHWQRCQLTKNFHAFAAGFSFLLSLHGGLTRELAIKPKTPSTVLNKPIINDVVYGMIAYSDMRRYPMDSQSVYTAATANVDWGSVQPFADEQAFSNAWGGVKYATDAFMGNAPAGVQSQLLLINGEIDGQTPRNQSFNTFADITMAGSGTKAIACIPDQGHHASGFGCGLNVAKSFYAGAVDTSCAMTSFDAPVQGLGTNFDIAAPFSGNLLSLNEPFDGAEVPGFCQNGGSESSCNRCLDYCIMKADNGENSYCSCLSGLSACYAQAGVANPVGTCVLVQTIYDTTLSTPAFTGCSTSCSAGTGLALTYLQIGLIIGGSLIGFGFFASVCVLVMRNRGSTSGGIVRQGPGLAQVPVVTAVAVTAANPQHVSIAVPASAGAGQVLSGKPVTIGDV